MNQIKMTWKHETESYVQMANSPEGILHAPEIKKICTLIKN